MDCHVAALLAMTWYRVIASPKGVAIYNSPIKWPTPLHYIP